MNNPATPQPLPQGGRTNIFDLVHEDLRQREQIGMETYGQTLMSHDGRDSLVEAYQEALDMCVYLRKAIEERAESGGPEGIRKKLLIGRYKTALEFAIRRPGWLSANEDTFIVGGCRNRDALKAVEDAVSILTAGRKKK